MLSYLEESMMLLFIFQHRFLSIDETIKVFRLSIWASRLTGPKVQPHLERSYYAIKTECMHPKQRVIHLIKITLHKRTFQKTSPVQFCSEPFINMRGRC